MVATSSLDPGVGADHGGLAEALLRVEGVELGLGDRSPAAASSQTARPASRPATRPAAAIPAAQGQTRLS